MDSTELKISYEKLLPAILHMLVEIRAGQQVQQDVDVLLYADTLTATEGPEGAQKTFGQIQEIHREAFDRSRQLLFEDLNKKFG